MIRLTRSLAIPLPIPFTALALVAGIGFASARADDLSDNLAKWQRMRPAHYQFESGYSCFCMPVTYLVEAEGAVVTQAKPVVFSSEPPPTSLQSHSIDSTFAWLKKAQDGKPSRFEVTYDPEFGFPSRVYIDYNQNIGDDEIYYGIDKFKVIPPVLILANDKTRRGSSAGWSGWRGGLWLDQDRAFAPNGKRVPAHR